jgi:serine/threonine protein kinase
MEGQHDPKVDIWSMGAILYYMTYGKQPNWNPENRNWEPPYGHCPVNDPLIEDLLKKTLQYQMENRPNINMLLNHPYTRLP